jgi:hypothetical protein
VPAPESIEAGLADGTYKHAHDPILSGGVDDYGEYVNVGYYVPFIYRRTFIGQACGLSSTDQGETWSITGPRECEIEGCSNLYPFGVRWEGFGELNTSTDGTPIAYSDVRVIIQYRTPFYNWGGGGFNDPLYLHSLSPNAFENQLLLWSTQEVETRTEVFRIPNRKLVWGDGAFAGDMVDSPVTRTVKYQQVTVTFLRVPYIPRGLGAITNTLNNQPFFGYDTGKVWFQGYRTQMRSWVGGIRTRSITLDFAIRREADWNMRLNKNLQWATVETDTGATMLEYGDLRNALLLQFIAQTPI